jgi:hypothetical protein
LNYYKILNQSFPELDLDEPFPHVTLYTFNSKKGIGIYSEDEFYEFKEDHLLKSQINVILI